MVASKTSFVLAAVALGAASVYAAPTPLNAGSSDLATRGFEDDEFALEARFFDDDELEAREFDDEELEARDFSDDEELYARDFSDDEELYARDFFDEEDELVARDFDDEEELMAREYFDDEEDLFARDFDDEEELFARDQPLLELPLLNKPLLEAPAVVAPQTKQTPQTLHTPQKPETPQGKVTPLVKGSTESSTGSPKGKVQSTKSHVKGSTESSTGSPKNKVLAHTTESTKSHVKGSIESSTGSPKGKVLAHTKESTTPHGNAIQGQHRPKLARPNHLKKHQSALSSKQRPHHPPHHSGQHRNHKLTTGKHTKLAAHHHAHAHAHAHAGHKLNKVHAHAHAGKHTGKNLAAHPHAPKKPLTTSSKKLHTTTGKKNGVKPVTGSEHADPAVHAKKPAAKSLKTQTATNDKPAGKKQAVENDSTKPSKKVVFAKEGDTLVSKTPVSKPSTVTKDAAAHEKPTPAAKTALTVDTGKKNKRGLSELWERFVGGKQRGNSGHHGKYHGHHGKKLGVNVAAASAEAVQAPVEERDVADEDMVILARSLGLDDDYFLEERSFDDEYEY